MEEFPPLVRRGRALARQVGFPLSREEAGFVGPSASLPGVGRFLAMLAAGCIGGRIGELGTGAGVGAPPTARGGSADRGDRRRRLPRHAQPGTLRPALRRQRRPRPARFAALVSWLRIGGRIVMDDITPERVLAPDSPLRADDLKRGFFTSEPRLVWTE